MISHSLPEGYSLVYTVTDYYDGPRKGVADFDGRPHYYESAFDEARVEWADYFWLTPLDEETFVLVTEDWAIWTRWYAAFQAGKTTQQTHPALPEEMARHLEIESRLDSKMIINPGVSFKAKGDFEAFGPKRAEQPFAPLCVRWELVS